MLAEVRSGFSDMRSRRCGGIRTDETLTARRVFGLKTHKIQRESALEGNYWLDGLEFQLQPFKSFSLLGDAWFDGREILVAV